MRQTDFTKIFLAGALILPLFTGPGSAAAPRAIHQNCNGVLTQQDGFYSLTPDPGSGEWCDAYVSDKYVHRVLKVCAAGSRCHISGSVRGHGNFYWTSISSVAPAK
jgi:hypothetical protein